MFWGRRKGIGKSIEIYLNGWYKDLRLEILGSALKQMHQSKDQESGKTWKEEENQGKKG